MKFSTRQSLLQHLRSQQEEQLHTMKKHFLPLGSANMAWKSDHKAWSIRDCFEHLNIYARYYGLQMRLRTGDLPVQKGGRHERFRSGWLGSWIIQSMDPSNGKKYQTLSRYQPKFGEPDANPVQELIQHLEETMVLLDRAEGLNLNQIRIPIQFFPLLTLNLGDCLHFMLLHQARHIAQAKTILQHTDNPLLVAI